MDLPTVIAWLVDEAGTSPDPESFLAEMGRRLLADGLPLAGGALTIAAPHPIIARRTWLWRVETGAVIEALSFVDTVPTQAGHEWLSGLGAVHEDRVGLELDGPVLGWAGTRAFAPDEIAELRLAARFAAPSLAALAARAGSAALLEAYLGRRSASRVQAGALSRGLGETISAALLCADLRDFTALSEATEPAVMITTLDAWFDRIAGAVHAFGGEVLKFMGDGVLAIFPVTSTPGSACEAALRAAGSARAGMMHLDTIRNGQGLPSLPFGVALHFGEILWGNIGAADRLDFTAIGPAVNLVSRLEGLCKPLGHTVLLSGAVKAEVSATLVFLGRHTLRGIAEPCAVFALPDN
ncbi:guanylyl cyclase [Rhizobium sp. R72]|uniref:adenylate/guanylate cyclase domain-containing protein n=1 Tax=unclassified Rhizobium TaxID=2613769 RepID=UPI000B533C8D|nr:MULTISPECIES: adenylate/guanylate cyclase domain-containing protein [unclassified Rhizobium]OWW04822.1 guanylyl cyclase [Rhizobium sp. R72]OWW05879.1 guanylyl cyclase [Rhizobium sp. R711]